MNNGLNYLSKNVPDLKRNDATWQYNRTAFILYVLARADQLRPSQVNFIYENRTSLSLYGKAYLAQAMNMLDAQDERIATRFFLTLKLLLFYQALAHTGKKRTRTIGTGTPTRARPPSY